MADAKQYNRGSNAKLAGLEYDTQRNIDWRMGWLETKPELNGNCATLPPDWAQQVKAFRKVIQNPDHSRVTLTLELSSKQAKAVARLCDLIATVNRQKLSADSEEAQQMQAGIRELQKVLTSSGY